MRHNMLFLYTRVHRDLTSIPGSVKVLITGLFVYLLAWGIIDPFLSIFLHSIVKSYSVAGFLYGLFFLSSALLSIPAGGLADRVNKIKSVAAGMLSYPLIGVLYFALAFVSSVFVIPLLLFVRILHGIAATFWVMAESFIREHSAKGETSATFGLYIMFYNLAYVLGPVFVIPLVLFFGLGYHNLHFLLLSLIPFPILGAVIVSRVKGKGEPISSALKEVVVKDRVFEKELLDLRAMGLAGIACLFLGFFMKAIHAVVMFLLPLYAVASNFSLVEISLLFAAVNLPLLFSFFLAELSDSFGKVNTISFGFAAAGLLFLALGILPPAHIIFFAVSLALGLVLALLQPAVNGLLTDITPRVEDGEMTGLFVSILNLSGFVSALALGILSDAFNLQFPFVIFAVLIILMAIVTYSIKSRFVVRI